MSTATNKALLEQLPAVAPDTIANLAKDAFEGDGLAIADRLLTFSAEEARRDRDGYGKDAHLALAGFAMKMGAQALRLDMLAEVERAGMRVALELLAEMPEGPALIRWLDVEMRKARAAASISLPGTSAIN